MMVLAVLVVTIALTWAGADYLANHVVQPLMDEDAAPSPGYLTP